VKTLNSTCLAVLICCAPAFAQSSFSGFTPGNLAVSRSVYTGTAASVTIGQPLPPNCPATASCGTGTATNNGAFPAIGSTNNVWNNDTVDGSFGITSPIFIDQLTPTGTVVNTLSVPGATLTTSFSSKSELAVNLSTDGTALTFVGYSAPPNTLDVSNSNTPGVYDPTNPVGSSYYRSVAQVSAAGAIQITPTNAYSGNNGRAAVLANGFYYMVGNDNNGSGTPQKVVTATGTEIATPGQPNTTVPQEIGTFSISQVNNPATGTPYPADKAGKDNNFRGLTIFNNTMYVTKGSGSNGINTVYQVGAAGVLPTLATAAATPITILPGFPVTLAKNAGAQYPFGIWFANATTLYVGDEGDGTMATAATSPTAGLQKWVLTNGVWTRVYVLQNGLNLGQSYGVTGYPAALNPVTGGLRNITGRVNTDGTVTVWGLTATVSANGDQGADPNKLVAINDILLNTDPTVAGSEQFTTIKSAGYGEVLRGVSLTPGTVAIAPPGLAIVSAASPVPGSVAPNSIATGYGTKLATATATRVALPFLSTSLGGTSVTIVDSTGASFAAGMLSASPSLVTFVVPSGVAKGSAQVTVLSGDGTKSTAMVQVNTIAPSLFTLNAAGLAAADVVSASAGSQGPTPSVYGMNSDGTIVANPISVSAGNVSLALFGTGIQTAGTAGVTVTVNGASVPVSYAGAQVSYPGLDQVNIQLPATLAGSGNVAIQLTANGVAANIVHVVIQ
jgi:uncharacterized protein (TIGR03437 family)